VDLKMF